VIAHYPLFDESQGGGKRRAALLIAKPLALLTNGFALVPGNVPFSRTAIVGPSNRQWTMSLYHRRPVRRRKDMPLSATLKMIFSWQRNLVQSSLMSAEMYLDEWRTSRWERGFAALTKFRAREGQCCPSRQHVEGGYELGQWVSVQRYRKDLLPVERKRRLEAIGFVWDYRDYLWEQNFAALLKFKRREGHCCVPTHYREGDLKLGWWVATQRRNRKEISPERRARLNKIGFVWSVGKVGISPRLLTDQVRRAFAKAPAA
jgi:hypothetical protein